MGKPVTMWRFIPAEIEPPPNAWDWSITGVLLVLVGLLIWMMKACAR